MASKQFGRDPIYIGQKYELRGDREAHDPIQHYKVVVRGVEVEDNGQIFDRCFVSR